MNDSPPSEIVPDEFRASEPVDGWFLTPDEEKAVLASARYNKIKRVEWQLKGNPNGSTVTDLTEEEETAALVQANKIKEAKLFFDQIKVFNRERRNNEQRAIFDEWTYGRFYKELKDRALQRGETLIYNDQTAPLIKTICFRLSWDERYQSEMGLSFRKGLILRGEPGLGKSWLLELLADNPVCPVQNINLNEITAEVRRAGIYEGLKFGSHGIVHLGDVGTEETPVKYYGTEINWFREWFEVFYENSKPHFNKIIISTNLSFQQIEEKYGFRVRDRMAECFDVLDLQGKSLRRKI